MLEMPNCNAATFQIFLNELSKQNPEEYKILVLDNGAFHKAKSLTIPENIALIFLPPYSPELNPAKKCGQSLKECLPIDYLKVWKDLVILLEKLQRQ